MKSLLRTRSGNSLLSQSFKLSEIEELRDAGTIEEVYEPYLVKNEFIHRTPKGRVVTERTYSHFGL